MMTTYELITKLTEANTPDTPVMVNVVADGMEYEFESAHGRMCCIGVDIDKNVEICDAYLKTDQAGKEVVMIDLCPM